MMLALPPDLTGSVIPVAQVDYSGLAASSDPVLLLFRDIEGVVRARDAGLTPALAREVNLGNVHYAPGRFPVTPSVFLSPEEMRQIEELSAAGFHVDARAV